MFSVPVVERQLRQVTSADNCRLAAKSSTVLASALEYLTAEICELAGNSARDMCLKMIRPRHILLAIRQDSELNALFPAQSKIICGGGVVPNILMQLLPKLK